MGIRGKKKSYAFGQKSGKILGSGNIAFNPQLDSCQLEREGRGTPWEWQQNKENILSIYHTPEHYLAFIWQPWHFHFIDEKTEAQVRSLVLSPSTSKASMLPIMLHCGEMFIRPSPRGPAQSAQLLPAHLWGGGWPLWNQQSGEVIKY